MNREEIQLLFDYNYWANGRVLAAAGRVTPEQFVAPAGLSHGSVRATLVHMLAVEVVWRLRLLEGTSPTSLLAEGEFPTVEALAARWQAEERAMRDSLAALTDEALAATVKYTTTRGVPYEDVLWHLLLHVVNHGTQSRAEAGVGLAHLGQSPGDLDLLVFLRARQGGGA